MLTPLETAQYELVHGYPGGAVALANQAGMNAGTLSNKVNPAMESHKLSVGEAVTLQIIAEDYRILHAEAAALGHVCIPLGDYSSVSDIEILNAYTKLNKEIGEHAGALDRALSDRRVSKKEIARVDKELFDMIRAGFVLRARLEALADA